MSSSILISKIPFNTCRWHTLVSAQATVIFYQIIASAAFLIGTSSKKMWEHSTRLTNKAWKWTTTLMSDTSSTNLVWYTRQLNWLAPLSTQRPIHTSRPLSSARDRISSTLPPTRGRKVSKKKWWSARQRNLKGTCSRASLTMGRCELSASWSSTRHCKKSLYASNWIRLLFQTYRCPIRHQVHYLSRHPSVRRCKCGVGSLSSRKTYS